MGPIHAIYENGVFKPTEPVSLPEFAPVVVTPCAAPAPATDPPEENPESTALERAIAWAESLKNRTPEQLEADRRRIFALSPPPTPIPEGKTLADMVEGTWPGDETDEQIREALEKLS